MLNQTDLSRADLNLLVLFEIVLDERHVGRAAERLNLSPSAVSHGLGRLRRLLNDPLFLEYPREWFRPRAQRSWRNRSPIFSRACRSVVSIAEPFDPATSTRRFTIGAPDGASAVVLPPLLAYLRGLAPGIDISVRQLLPPHGSTTFERAWEPACADLEARAIDIAIVPLHDIPAQFVEQALYEEEFVIASRAGHPYAKVPTLDRFCSMRHLLVSLTGDAHGFVDEALAKQRSLAPDCADCPEFHDGASDNRGDRPDRRSAETAHGNACCTLRRGEREGACCHCGAIVSAPSCRSPR